MNTLWKKPLQLLTVCIIIIINDKYCTEAVLRTNRCSQTYRARSGTFSSPAYNLNSSKNVEKCEWRIRANHGERIVLNISNIEIKKSLACTTAYVEIRDGLWLKSPLLGKFCGIGRLDAVTSTGRNMYINYVVNTPTRNQGFTANYEAICGDDLFIDQELQLQSPDYPQNYPLNKKCIWNIVVPESSKVVLNFQFFDLENQTSCLYDYVEIREGLTPESNLIGVYCGQNIPANIISTSNYLQVKFVSDASVQKSGFSATIMNEYDECATEDHHCAQKCIYTLGSYKCACEIGYELHSDGKQCEKACGGVLDAQNGTITSPSFPDLYPLNKTCIWEIVSLPQHHIILKFNYFDLEGPNMTNYKKYQCHKDRLEIFSKFNNQEMKLHGVYCGTHLPNPIVSYGNMMRIIFSSDKNEQKNGFSIHYVVDDRDQCAINNGNCQHQCLNTIDSHKCVCRDGFFIQENGLDCKDDDCNYEISSLSGYINNPSFPQYDSSDRNCIWQFTTTPGHKIQLTFHTLDILNYYHNCEYNNVAIYDGSASKSQLINRFCTFSSSPIISSNNELYISMSIREGQGKFQAAYSTVCGGRLEATSEEKHIYSHAVFGSFDYNNMSDCEWTITALVDHKIHISFVKFQLEDDSDCEYDYVEILDGSNSNGKFCGFSKPADIFSLNNRLTIRFHSDNTIVSKGFDLTYNAIKNKNRIEEEQTETFIELD